jgi:hypothetical protein
MPSRYVNEVTITRTPEITSDRQLTSFLFRRFCPTRLLLQLQLIAILPGTALYVFLGASAERLTMGMMMEEEEDSSSSQSSSSSRKSKGVTIGIIVTGVVLGVGAIVMTTRYARRELRRILELDEEGKKRLRQQDEDEKEERRHHRSPLSGPNDDMDDNEDLELALKPDDGGRQVVAKTASCSSSDEQEEEAASDAELSSGDDNDDRDDGNDDPAEIAV